MQTWIDNSFVKCSFLLLLATTGIAHAASSTPPANGAEVALFTPWSFVNTTLSSSLASQTLKAESQVPQTDLTVDPLTWHLSGLQWNVSTQVVPGKWDSQSLDVAAKNLQLNLQIQQLSVNQYIQKVVNGAVLNILVQAQCGPVTLTQSSAQVSAHLTYQVSSQKITTQVNNFNLQWPAQSWQVSNITCSNSPIGFDKTLKDQLVQELQSADKIKPWAQAIVSQKLQDVVNAELAQLALPVPLPAPQIPTPLTLNLQSLQSLPEGVLATGILSWAGKKDEPSNVALDMKELPSTAAKSKTPLLLTRMTAMSDLIEAQLKARENPTKINLQQQAFFQKLIKSRLTQAFVWPDLWNYSAKDPFWLKVPTPQNVTLKWLHDGSASFQFSDTAEITSIREGHTWDYIDMPAQALGRLTPTISEGLLKVQISLTGSHFSAHMNEKYIFQFNPNTYLSSSLLTSLQSAVNEGMSYQVQLPSLDLGPLGVARANGWQVQGEDFLSMPIALKAK